MIVKKWENRYELIFRQFFENIEAFVLKEAFLMEVCQHFYDNYFPLVQAIFGNINLSLSSVKSSLYIA